MAGVERKQEEGEEKRVIENMNMDELMGQMELGDVMKGMTEAVPEAGPCADEGYDTDGRLINPGDMPATAGADRLGVIAAEIHAITEQTRGVVISAALQIGKRLIEAKGLVPPGRWGEWLEASVDYSERRAQDLMRLYEEYGRADAIPESIARLDYSKAVALLAAPEEAREELAEKVNDEGLSVRQLNEEIRRLKAEKLKAQMQIEDLQGKIEGQRDEIHRMDDREQAYDRAIVERDDQLKAANAAIEREREAAKHAEAKAAAAEASAQELRKLHSDAEDRAAASAQRASDAVNRANETAKKLSEARARIAELEAREPEVRTVTELPDSARKEMEDLKSALARAEAKAASLEAEREATSGSGAGAPPSTEKAEGATAVEKFKWFYSNQMKPTFSTALTLLREVAMEDGHAANMFATALTNGCKQLMNQLGEESK